MDLDLSIEEIVKELGVIVTYDEIEKSAYFLASFNLIVVNCKLSSFQKKIALLHELGHACKHKNNYVLYKKTFSLHSKMEKEAEEFMIEKMIEARFNDPEFELSTFSVTNFLESYQIDYNYEPIVKEFMTRYFTSVEMNPIFF